ncbi:hypothetical protein [Paenibacillus sp. SC116]|uniref:hypothetical protein n=1 Tax=Paenibacillus sp. SC116 TaxID=2968986 RepID=UPI00215A922A|nr:hypothetical protein [Paenibacillus sp. SC116]
MLAACTGRSKSELPPMPESGEGVIKVLYWNEEQFMKDYGSSFNVKYPDIEFEIVSTAFTRDIEVSQIICSILEMRQICK